MTTPQPKSDIEPGIHEPKSPERIEFEEKLKHLEKPKNASEVRFDATCKDCAFFQTPKCSHVEDHRTFVEGRRLMTEDDSCGAFQPQVSCFFDEERGFIPAKLAEWIMSRYTFATMMDNLETYVYKDGVYQPVGDALIKKLSKDALQDEYRKNRATETQDYIKASTLTSRREEPASLLPLANGILDLSQEPYELKSYSPDFMFFNKIPVKYDPEADCPAINKFMQEITNNEDDIALLKEMMGFCLYREYFIAKALMLVGGGSNGKSTFLNLVKAFLGSENVSGRSLQDLELHRFAKADLYAKLANIYADLPDKALKSTGTFKMLTGRDLITAEKKFGQPFHYVNSAKLLFSANKVPEANDDTTAFFRRWEIMVFSKIFLHGKNADPYILDKLTTEKELSGLLNRVLESLRHLIKTGEFSSSKTVEETKEDYIRKSSPIAAFVQDCLEVDSDAFIEKKALYGVFAEYCRSLKLPIVQQDTFFKSLSKYINVTDYRPSISKIRLYTFRGIRYAANVSKLSMVSRVFHTSNEVREQFKEKPYYITELPSASLIKVEITLDTIDTLDATSHKLTLKEQLEEIKSWLLANKDQNSLVDSQALASKCRELGLDMEKTVKILLDDYQIFEVPQIGKYGVKT